MKKVYIKMIIFSLILGFIVFVLVQLGVDNQNYEMEEVEDYTKYYTSETVIPRNVGELYAYNGVNTYTDLFISMNIFTNYISDIQKSSIDNNNAEELKQFFSENQTEIKSKLSISNVDDFIKLMDYINDYDLEKEKLDYAEIIKNSVYREDNYYWVAIKFVYKENEKPIMFKVGLATKGNNKVIVKYNFEQYMENYDIIENVVN